MTNEKAIETIEDYILNNVVSLEVRCALEIAMYNIDKNIPKKPRGNHCPVCGYLIGFGSRCEECGQVIRGEDEKVQRRI